MITDYSEILGMFRELDSVIKGPVTIFIIGGGAMMKHRLKARTKDIDIVVRTDEEYDAVLDAFASLGFASDIPSGPYGRLSIPGILTRGALRVDLFCREVCGKFSLSDGMALRASDEKAGLDRISLKVCSPNDVFLFKTMTERDGDEDDCARIIREFKLNWPMVLDEAVKQSETGRSVWITWIAARLEYFADKKLEIPILGEIVRLADEYIDGWMRTRDTQD